MTAHDWYEFFACVVGGGIIGWSVSHSIEHWRRRPMVYRDRNDQVVVIKRKGG